MENSNKSSESQNLNISNKKDLKDYRAWPIFMLSFVRLFYVSIFERALQNYLYFVIDIKEGTLGLIVSAGSLAYISAPAIGQVITRKLGIRNSLILSSLATPLLTGFQVIYFEPWFLITCRVLLGLALGLFWPNCFNLLSKWQKLSSIEKSKNNFRNFNFSWNFGFLSGLITGYLWAFIWNDYLAMVISWSLSFLLIPISFYIEKESITNIKSVEIPLQVDDYLAQIDLDEISSYDKNLPLIVFPILFSWLTLMFLVISKSIFIFSYPILLKSFQKSSSFTYIIQFGIQLTQLIGLTLSNSMRIYIKKITTLISFLFLGSISISILFARNIWYISIIFPFAGLFIGLIQGVSMKIMLEHGSFKSTTKYSTINEILVGIGFGLTPIIVGQVAEINIYPIFGFHVILGIFLLIFLIFLSRHIKKES